MSSFQFLKVSRTSLKVKEKHKEFTRKQDCWDWLDKQDFQKAMQGENEKQDRRIQRKERIRGPTPIQGEGADTESKPALLYFQQWMKEYAGN